MKKILIFDMDNTLLSCDSMEKWHDYLDLEGFMTESDVQNCKRLKKSYLEGTLDIYENFRFEFILLNKINRLTERIDHFFNSLLKPYFSNIALDIIEQGKIENNEILLSTSTMSCIAKPVAEFIGANHFFATYGDIKKNQYTGIIDGVPNYQDGKRINFISWINGNLQDEKYETVFYSDSFTDLPLFLAVDKPVAVNPDEKLLNYAKDNNWKIQYFKS